MGRLRVGFAAAIVAAAFACSNQDPAASTLDCTTDAGELCRDGAQCSASPCGLCTCVRGVIQCEGAGGLGDDCDRGYEGGRSPFDANFPPPPNAIVVGVKATKLVVDSTYVYWLDPGGSIFRVPKLGGTAEHVDGPLADDFALVDGGFVWLARSTPYPPYLARSIDDGGVESFPYPAGLLAASGPISGPLWVPDDRAIVSTANGKLGVYAFDGGDWSSIAVSDGGSTRIVGEGATELAAVVSGSPPMLVVLDRETLVPTRAVVIGQSRATAFYDGTAYVGDGVPDERFYDGSIERVASDGATTPFPVPENPAAMTSDSMFLYAASRNLYAVRHDDAGAVALDGDGAAPSFFGSVVVVADNTSLYVYASEVRDGTIYRFPKPAP